MRQFTLVSHYGQKTGELASWIRHMQTLLEHAAPGRFRPYCEEQVHCTIIGLEGYRSEGYILNRYTHKPMDLSGIVARIKSCSPMLIQIGGFKKQGAYKLTSRNKSLYERSFTINSSGSAVSIGWPKADIASATRTVDLLRRDFQQFNVCHKYYFFGQNVWQEDNDLFFLLGKFDRGTVLNDEERLTIAEQMRGVMQEQSLELTVQSSTLVVVGYVDRELPTTNSICLDGRDKYIVDTMEKSYPP